MPLRLRGHRPQLLRHRDRAAVIGGHHLMRHLTDLLCVCHDRGRDPEHRQQNTRFWTNRHDLNQSALSLAPYKEAVRMRIRMSEDDPFLSEQGASVTVARHWGSKCRLESYASP